MTGRRTTAPPAAAVATPEGARRMGALWEPRPGGAADPRRLLVTTPEQARAALVEAVAALQVAQADPTKRPEGVGALSRARVAAERAGVAGPDVDEAWRAAMRGDLGAAVELAGRAVARRRFPP